MARKGAKRRRSNRNFVALPVNDGITLATLADNAVIKNTSPAILTEDLYMISTEIVVSLQGITVGEGAIIFGMADNDLTVAEIAENLTTDQLDPNDIIARERARRPVRVLGIFSAEVANRALNSGMPLKKRIKLTFGSAKGFCFFAFNRSGASLTTGAVISIDGVLYGRWLR